MKPDMFVVAHHKILSVSYKVSLESEIIRYMKYHVNPETDKIKIKISGDGSKVSRISNFVVLSFFVIIDV
jgi:hypothetical protein